EIKYIELAVLLVLIPSAHSFYVILAYFLTFLMNLTRIGPDLLPMYPSTASGQNATYDFIVVGSGPTGSVIANRLTEDGRWSVLLLESGDEAGVITNPPVFAGAIEFTKYNWEYRSEPQEGFCRGCIDGRMQYPHGNVMGGSSTINYMMYTRGNKLDYDRWAAMGNPGWSYDEILPYFLKSEDAHIAIRDDRYHQEGGYLGVSDVPYRSKVSGVYIEAAEEAGHPYVDYNGARQLGVSYIQTTTKDGRRSFAEKAFIRPVRQRSNLRVQTKCRVSKILIDQATATARGVEYISRGRTHEAFANKEVILSAGVLNSPQVLMLSGIGPKDHLDSLGIPVLRDLPVGRQLYDHASYPGLVFTLNESIAIHQISSLLNPLTYTDYLFRGRGFLTTIGGVEAITFFKSNVSTDPDPSYPDMELFFVGGSLATDFGLYYRKKFNVPPRIFNKIFLPLIFTPTYQIFPLLIHPKSVGYIELRSKNPMDSPRFYTNYFSDPENHDVKTFIAGIREAQRISQSPALQKYAATLVSTPVPGCESITFNTDQYWECCLRTIIGSEYHQTATCRMGPQGDPQAVVDARLRVHGINKLRVADTSVIPITISGHTVAPAYMIGEKGADIIKEDHR
ncbi:unnamed protein product, partial [Phaedon cochleariae]